MLIPRFGLKTEAAELPSLSLIGKNTDFLPEVRPTEIDDLPILYLAFSEAKLSVIASSIARWSLVIAGSSLWYAWMSAKGKIWPSRVRFLNVFRCASRKYYVSFLLFVIDSHYVFECVFFCFLMYLLFFHDKVFQTHVEKKSFSCKNSTSLILLSSCDR